MNEFEKNDIEKLKQEQLIKSILSRTQLETDALIQAVKENSNNVEKRKQEILNTKLKEQENENKKQLEERKTILDTVEEDLKKWNEEEKLAALKRKETVNQILGELNISNSKKTLKLSENQKARARLEKIERERFRRSFQETTRKRIFLDTQVDLLKKEENKKAILNNFKSSSKVTNVNSTSIPANNKKIIISEDTQKNINSSQSTQKPQSVSPFKMLKGIRAYEDNMRFYSQSQARTTIGKILKSITQPTTPTDTKKGFLETLKAKVDHKEALKKSQQQKPRFTPRTL